jgi:hypothetical protein
MAEDEDDEVDTLFLRLKRWHRRDSEHWAKWRKEAREDYSFVSGEQWDVDDVRVLKAAARPVITFNRIDPMIRSVTGEQINNAQMVTYLPREEGDAVANELLTSAALWFRDQSDAEDEESDAFWDLATCGVGWTDTRLDVEEDPTEPMPLVERIDPLEMTVDADSTRRNFTGARRIWRIRDMPLETAERIVPEADSSELDASWARSFSSDDPDDETKYDDTHNEPSDTDRKITLVQCQWWDLETTGFLTVDPESGEMVTIPPENADEARPVAEALGLPFEKIEGRVYYSAFLGRKIFKKKKLEVGQFTFQALTGFRDRNTGTWYGLVRAMKDPQRWANKWLSQTLHIMNSNAKGGVMIEEGAVDDQAAFEKSYAKPDAVTWVPDGSLGGANGGRIKEKQQTQFPSGFFQLMDFAIRSVRDVSGVNLEMLGMREANQPASLEYQRRQAGVTILAQLFRAMRRYHRTQGKVMLYYIQNYLSDGRLIKILGDEASGRGKFVPLIRPDGADVKYDIIVDEGPSAPNQKERVWNLVGERFWDLPPDMQLTLIEFSPFPASVVAKIKEAAKSAQEGPQAELEQQMQKFTTELAGMKVMVEEARSGLLRAETKEAQASAVLKLTQAQQNDGPDLEIARIMAKAEADAAEIRRKSENDIAKLQVTSQDQKIKNEIAGVSAIGAIKGKERSDAIKLRVDREKIDADIQTNREWMASEEGKSGLSNAAGVEKARITSVARNDKPSPNKEP